MLFRSYVLFLMDLFEDVDVIVCDIVKIIVIELFRYVLKLLSIGYKLI